MGISKDILMRFLPLSMRLPAWYLVKKIQGTIDDEIEYVKKRIVSNRCMIDVGANIGIYSFAFRKHCRIIHAFEPQPDCVRVLKSYGSKKILVYQVALSDTPGIMDLHIPVKNGSKLDGLASLRDTDEDSIVERVKVDVLDRYHFTDVSVLKIDVEGHEMNVLYGAIDTINREHPFIIIEIEQRHIDIPIGEIFKFIEAKGYKGGFILNGEWYPIDEFKYEIHQKPFETDLYQEKYHKIKGFYINNFIFEPIKK